MGTVMVEVLGNASSNGFSFLGEVGRKYAQLGMKMREVLGL